MCRGGDSRIASSQPRVSSLRHDGAISGSDTGKQPRLAPRNQIADSQGVEQLDEHLLAVDAVREAGPPDLDGGRNVVPGAVEDEVCKFPGSEFTERSGFEAMHGSDLFPVPL